MTKPKVGAVVKPKRDPAKLRLACVESAAATIGKLEPGIRLVGITKGHFSMLDLIRAVLDQTGPAHVTIATWTSGIRDAETAAWLLDTGRILKLRFMTDRSFVTRKPEYALAMRNRFGAGSFIGTTNHAKFSVIRNGEWSVVIRGSMNLNRNDQWEQFDLDDDAELADFFDGIVDELEAKGVGFGDDIPRSELSERFESTALDHPARVPEIGAAMLAGMRSKSTPAEEVKRLALIGFAWGEIMTRVRDDVGDDEDGTFRAIYDRARLTLEETMREATVTAAIGGNPQARDRVSRWLTAQRGES